MRFALVAPVVLVEGASARDALGRSRWLVQGFFWKTLGLTVIVMLFLFVVSWGAQGAISLFAPGLMDEAVCSPDDPSTWATGQVEWWSTYSLLSTITSHVVTIVVQPIGEIAAVLLYYYDLRIRKEGYDIELLAAEVGGERS